MKDKEVRKILLNLDFRVLFKELSFENAGRMLFEVMDKYAEQKELSLEDPTTLAYAKMWCADVDIALKYSRKKSETNSKNGQKGGEQTAKNRRKREAEQQQQPEPFKEETANGNDVPIVEAEEVEPYPFEFFWREYISHKDEKNARNIWAHLYDDSRKKAIDGAKIYTQYVLARKAKDPNFDAILKPSTYLKDAHWNDEYKEEELTPQNYGNNRSYQSDYERRKQQQNAVLTDFMAEAAARVQAIEDAKNRVENI